MAMRKRKATEAASPQYALDGALLLDAFHHAWEGALAGELINSRNVLYAPREMLQSVLVASQTAPNIQKSKELGEFALAGWRALHNQKADFEAAVPPTDAIN
jgi:hypothetical protein